MTYPQQVVDQTFETSPDTGEHVFLPLHLARFAMFVALSLSATSCALWVFAEQMHDTFLSRWIRPSLCLPAFISAVALTVRLYAPSKKIVVWMCGGCGGVSALLSFSAVAYHIGVRWLHAGDIYASAEWLDVWGMMPMAAILIMGTSVAIVGRGVFATHSPWPTWVFIVAAFVSGDCLYMWILGWASGGVGGDDAGIGRHLLPVDAVILVSCNVGFIFADPDQRVVNTFVSPCPGSTFARHVLGWSTLLLLGFGTLRAALQAYGLVNLAEGTGLMVLAAVAVLGAVLYRHTHLFNDIWWAEKRSLASLEKALSERCELAEQVENERRRLTAVLAAATDYAIIAMDVNGVINLFNEGAESMLAYKAEEVVGRRTLLDFHDADELTQRARALGVAVSFDVFRAVYDDKKAATREWTYVRKDGQRLPVWLSVTALRDKDRDIVGYVSIARDLSLDKRNQREREGLLNIGQELLCLADTKGLLRLVSPSFARVTGHNPLDLVGRPYLDFIHSGDHEKTYACLSRLEARIPAERFENRWRTSDGRYRLISWDVSPPDSDGLMFCSGWDVTDEQARQRQLQQYLDFEKQLIGIVSHDLRNPVAAIALSAEAVEQHEELTQSARRHIQRITRASGRATRMIYDLLDFTKARLGTGLDIKPTLMDLGAVIGQVIDELRPAYPDHRIELRMTEPPTLEGDADRLAQVFCNLLANSLKYGDADEPVVISVEREQQGWGLALHNGGPPISPELMPHLFDPLRRGTDSGSDDHSVGLGLYIANEVVHAHGGRIEVQSADACGTTFTVHLPARQSQRAAETGQPDAMSAMR